MASCTIRVFEYANLCVEQWTPLLYNQQPAGKAQLSVFFTPKHELAAAPPAGSAPGVLAQSTQPAGLSVVQLCVKSGEGLGAVNTNMFGKNLGHSDPYVVVEGLCCARGLDDEVRTEAMLKTCAPEWVRLSSVLSDIPCF